MSVEKTVELVDKDGNKTVASVAALVGAFLSNARLMGITVSVKESRPRAAYQTHERFMSATIDLSKDWEYFDLTEALNPHAGAALREAFGQAVLAKIRGVEQTLFDEICAIQEKDGVTPYRRN